MVKDAASRADRAAESLEKAGFTKREYEVAMLLAMGAANKEVSQQLGITTNTARRHTESVMRKLGVDSRNKIAAKMLGLQLTRTSGTEK